MKLFELRFIDKRDVVIAIRVFEGADDDSALGEAGRHTLTHTIEVWEGPRWIARLPKRAPQPDGAPHGKPDASAINTQR